MVKKARSTSVKKTTAKKKSAHATALEANAAALDQHTKELALNSSALAAHTATLRHINARLLVYSVLNEPLTLSDTTQLSKLALDFGALAGTAAAIKARGVNVDTGLVQRCKTIADLVKVVATAAQS